MDKSEFLGVTTDTWDAITAIATAGTLLIAAIAAGVAAVQLLQTSAARLEQNRPYVVVTFDQSPIDVTFVDIVIRNVGAGPARNVAITVDPPLVRSVTMPIPDLGDAPYFKETIPLMPPGYELRMFYDSMVDRRERHDLPDRHTFRVRYDDGHGHPWDELSDQDLSLLTGLVFTERYGVHHVAKSLREIEKHVTRSPLFKGQVAATVESREDRQAREHLKAEQHRQRIAEYEQRQEQQRAASQEPADDDSAPDTT